MKLNVQERLGLLELLPKEGKYAALKEFRRAREIFALTPAEIIEYKYKETPIQGGVNIVWDEKTEKIKDVPITEFVVDTIRDILTKMEKEGHLTQQLFGLYEKFVIVYKST